MSTESKFLVPPSAQQAHTPPSECSYQLVIDQPGQQACAALAAHTGLSKAKIKQVMDKGAVWLRRAKHTQRLRRASKVMKIGDELFLYYKPAVLDTVPTAVPLIADEGSYSVWNKPSGVLSQGSKWSDHCTVSRWAEKQLQRPGYIVHRLDRAASGIILIAHEKRAAAKLSGLFQSREIHKRYAVTVEGEFPIEHLTRIDAAIDGKASLSVIERCEYDSEREQSDLLVKIESGRKHQIRRHLSEQGYPVVGDRLYGSATEGDVDLKLRAVSLRFLCPMTGIDRDYQVASDSRLKPPYD